MPLLQINAGPQGPELHGASRPLGHALADGLEPPGPIIIMVHGFKFAPGDAFDCPTATSSPSNRPATAGRR